jgi:AraC-like DNA-binding protein
MKYTGISEENLFITNVTSLNAYELTAFSKDGLLILWNMEEEMKLLIDGIEFNLSANQMIFLTEFNKITVKSVGQVRLIRFNRSFYCIIDHDHEVGCKGVLFFGATEVPIITVTEEESPKFETLWEMLTIEMNSRDSLQQEMLQIMLKRFIILSIRLYKSQHQLQNIEKGKLDIVREFNYLVEIHFRTKHSVAEYAELLNRSPKSLTNLFYQYNQKNPLQIIQDRILLETRRQLLYSDKIIKEIAYETGFEDIQTFSRFFKTKEGISPREYREKKLRNLLVQGEITNKFAVTS